MALLSTETGAERTGRPHQPPPCVWHQGRFSNHVLRGKQPADTEEEENVIIA